MAGDLNAITLDLDRTFGCSVAPVHAALLSALGFLGFEVTVDQLTSVEAHRGSILLGSVDESKVRVDLAAAAEPTDCGCHLHVRLSHGVRVATDPRSPVPLPVQRAFEEVLRGIDGALRSVEPAAVDDAPAPVVSAPTRDGIQHFTVAGTATTAGSERPALGGRSAPAGWQGRAGVVFETDDELATLDLDDLQAHLAIAGLVARQPASLPPHLTAELEALVVRVERSLGGASALVVRVPVSAEERKVVDFLHQQVRIRSRLPVRSLHRCRDCRYEKITNEDLERLLQRNRRLRGLTGAAGASIGRRGLSPFVLVGTLFQLSSLDPDYVCPRCQGMAAEETLVTFCPGCGDLRKDAVLVRCPKCHHDFRAGLGPDGFWKPRPSPAAIAAGLPIGLPPPGAAGGFRCQVCGQEYTALWRVVVDGPSGPVERFVCSTAPACAPASLVPPHRV